MTTLTDLVERLEKAEKGDRVLDFHVQIFLEDRIWPTRRRDGTIINPNARMSDYLATFEDVIAADDQDFDFPRYTTSLDAALTLVPEGWRPLIRRDPTCWRAALNTGKLSDLRVARSESQTPALALTIACLRARAS